MMTGAVWDVVASKWTVADVVWAIAVALWDFAESNCAVVGAVFAVESSMHALHASWGMLLTPCNLFHPLCGLS